MNARFHSILAVCFAVNAPAFAARITVDFTGHVSQVNDWSNLLGGQVSVGQTVSGSYSYDTGVQDGTPSSEFGSYPQTATQGSLALTVGPFAFETDPTAPYWWFEVDVRDAMFNSGASDSLSIFTDFKTPANLAIDGSSVQLQFTDYDGSSLQSDALPGGAPSLTRFPWSHASLKGWRTDGSFFDVTVDLDSAQNGGGSELTVSPASGLFVRQQPIVPALVLPPDTLVTGISGTFNGNEMPGYFWSCYPSWSQTRTVFVCPDASPNLMPGTNHVEWRLQMSDGTIIARIVDWELIQ